MQASFREIRNRYQQKTTFNFSSMKGALKTLGKMKVPPLCVGYHRNFGIALATGCCISVASIEAASVAFAGNFCRIFWMQRLNTAESDGQDDRRASRSMLILSRASTAYTMRRRCWPITENIEICNLTCILACFSTQESDTCMVGVQEA